MCMRLAAPRWPNDRRILRRDWSRLDFCFHDSEAESPSGMRVSIRTDNPVRTWSEMTQLSFRSHQNTAHSNAELQEREWLNRSNFIPHQNSIQYHVKTSQIFNTAVSCKKAPSLWLHRVFAKTILYPFKPDHCLLTQKVEFTDKDSKSKSWNYCDENTILKLYD